jgi:hypothetical protein
MNVVYNQQDLTLLEIACWSQGSLRWPDGWLRQATVRQRLHHAIAVGIVMPLIRLIEVHWVPIPT